MTLDEIIENHEEDLGIELKSRFSRQEVKLIAKRYAKAKLEEAAERAETEALLIGGEYVYIVYKESITKTPLE